MLGKIDGKRKRGQQRMRWLDSNTDSMEINLSKLWETRVIQNTLFQQQCYTLVIANTLFQQHKRRFYTCTSPDGQYQNQTAYILCNQRWRSSIQSAKIRPGADCGSDHELLIAKFRLKLKKVRKTTRPLKYDLNQIPCNYTVEVTDRFKD